MEDFPGTGIAGEKDKAISDGSAESNTDMSVSSDESEQEVCRPCRQRQLPTRYKSDSEDQNDGVLCTVCNQNEPEELSSDMVFWVDFDVCGAWVHTY